MIKQLFTFFVLALSVNFCYAQPTSAYCETEVRHLGIPAELASAIKLTIANVNSTTMIVEIESADAVAVDFLLVNGGSGATISPENFSIPGKISRTLTWASPPADVSLNVLWSKVAFGGNWQLSPSDVMVPFAAICPATPAPVSAYCETTVLHFNGDAGSDIKLTIANLDATSMYVEIESADADPVDFLLVNGGSGATISTENTSVPGKISRTLTWATPPTDVTLNVLWSKANFGGNWQLSAADITVPFAANCPGLAPPPPLPMGSIYCETEVRHLGIPGEVASAIKLTIANLDATTMYVEIESANADPVDLLMIVGGSGAAVSNENRSTPGKISRTLSWTSPPATVVLNVLWSKESFGGNWLVMQGDLMVPFSATCALAPPTPAPAPVFCNTEVRHLGIPGEVASAVFLTISNVNANTMIVEVESANADPVDFLLVNGGSGAMISAENTSVPGKISRTLTWASPPTDVSLNVLWSKTSFGGNWQLSPSDVMVAFATSCTAAVPTMGEWSMFLFALIMLTIGVVFVMSSQSKLRLATGETASAPVNFRRFPFNKSNYLNALKHALGLALIGFVIIYIGWGAIVFADLIGMSLSVFVMAYLIHLFYDESNVA